jgi:glucose/arabinose dehydrogenase
MRQLMNPPRSIVSLSLVFGAAALLAAACGSDENDPSTSQGQLTGGAPGTSGTGGQTAASGSGGAAGAPTASAGAGGLASGGSEGNPTDVPIDQQPPPEPPAGGAGAGGAPAQLPPTGVLAPNCDAPEGDVPNVALELVADGLTEPLYVTGVPGDDSRLMILQKGGTVRVVVDGVLRDAPFIDITSQVQNLGERGLLGLAFHPDYATNGLFYLHYSSSGAGDGLPGAGDTVLAEFQVDASNRDVANPASRRIVLTADQPEANHNGGQIAFGRDGMLYLGLGDGGGGNDQHGTIGNGQSLNTLLGKILRLDPTARDVNDAYGIPAGNLAQVTGQQALPEIWAYGLRNPWRFSFDACNGDLYIGDVGQNALEEIDYVAAAADTRVVPSGLNFGWRIMEGTQCGPQAAECNDQTTANLVLPVDEYPRTVGVSVTGGYVYRGSAIPGLRGQYIYADYATTATFRFRIENGAIADRTDITAQIVAPGGADVENISSFGVDNAGELYVVDYADADAGAGAVFRVVLAP